MKEIEFLLTFEEMNALLKLLHYIKFTCEDEEANILRAVLLSIQYLKKF